MGVQHDTQYLNLIKDVLANGTHKEDRTGTGTTSIFGRQMRFDLSDGTIPLLTTKKIHIGSVIHELLWYISGSSNIKYLNDNGVRIWNEWADGNGDLGPVYGHQWRNCPDFNRPKVDIIHGDVTFPHVIDQLAIVIDQLRNDPDSRRMIVNSWNVSQLPEMKLPPCHFCFQLYTTPLNEYEREKLAMSSYQNDKNKPKHVDEENLIEYYGTPSRRISLMIHQRSCDLFLGVPFNISQYSILLYMIAQVVNMVPDEMIWNGGDIHIYDNHHEQVELQLHRIPFDSPTISINSSVKIIDDFKFDDIKIHNYTSHESIKAKVAV